MAGAGCIVYPLLCVPSVSSDVVRVTARAEAGCWGWSGVTCSSTISPFSAPTSLHCPASTPPLVPVTRTPVSCSQQPYSLATCHVSRLVTCVTCPLLHGLAAGRAGRHLVEGCCSVRCCELLLRAAAGPVSAEHGLRSTPRLERPLSTAAAALAPPARTPVLALQPALSWPPPAASCPLPLHLACCSLLCWGQATITLVPSTGVAAWAWACRLVWRPCYV